MAGIHDVLVALTLLLRRDVGDAGGIMDHPQTRQRIRVEEVLERVARKAETVGQQRQNIHSELEGKKQHL